MRKNIANYVQKLDSNNFRNNVQEVLYDLLMGSVNGDGWVSAKDFVANSATSRVRDLRKEAFGGFNIVAKSGKELGRGVSREYFYRLTTSNLTVNKLRQIFD